jgi:YjbE family integral membrane protein
VEDVVQQSVKILEIIWINVILSGDNAVVIALACRGLPAHRKRTGMVLGAGVAVGLRIVFTLVVASLLTTPFLKILGSLLLFWIAVKLLTEDETEGKIPETERVWHAVQTIAVADAVMSLDNVLAIAAVAQGSWFLITLGLAISIPLVIAGATLLMALTERFPIFVWAGAGLLGWVAGNMLMSDPWLVDEIGHDAAHAWELPVAAAGALLVIGAGHMLRRRARQRLESEAQPHLPHG